MFDYLTLSPPAGRIFAIGDIHGCDDELGVLWDYLTGELSLSADDLVIFLGDYVDRGPSTRGVLERLVGIKRAYANTYFLRGNHEDMWLSFFKPVSSTTEELKFFLNGCDETLLEYPGIRDDMTAEEKQLAIDKSHISFIAETVLGIRIGKLFFSHSSMNPNCTLENQSPKDVLWTRANSVLGHYTGYFIIHGHTPVEQIVFTPGYYLNIDTKCFKGGSLSCVELRSGATIQVRNRSLELTVGQIKDWDQVADFANQ